MFVEYGFAPKSCFVVKLLVHLCLCSYSKPDQVIYSGAVKSREKVEEFQKEIGPEIVQTIKVLSRSR